MDTIKLNSIITGKTRISIFKVLCFFSPTASPASPASLCYHITNHSDKITFDKPSEPPLRISFSTKSFFAWVSTKSFAAENLRLIKCDTLRETYRQDKPRRSLLTSQFNRNYGVTISIATKLPEVYVYVKYVGSLVIIFVKGFTKLLMVYSQLTKALSPRNRINVNS